MKGLLAALAFIAAALAVLAVMPVVVMLPSAGRSIFTDAGFMPVLFAFTGGIGAALTFGFGYSVLDRLDRIRNALTARPRIDDWRQARPETTTTIP